MFYDFRLAATASCDSSAVTFSERQKSLHEHVVPSLPPCPEQSLSLPNVIAASLVMQVYQCFSYDIPFSLGIDTGASCNLLTVKAYSKFKDLFNLRLRPTDNNLFSVQGSPLQVLGTIVLPLSLAKHVPHLKLNSL